MQLLPLGGRGIRRQIQSMFVVLVGLCMLLQAHYNGELFTVNGHR